MVLDITVHATQLKEAKSQVSSASLGSSFVCRSRVSDRIATPQEARRRAHAARDSARGARDGTRRTLSERKRRKTFVRSGAADVRWFAVWTRSDDARTSRLHASTAVHAATASTAAGVPLRLIGGERELRPARWPVAHARYATDAADVTRPHASLCARSTALAQSATKSTARATSRRCVHLPFV